MQDIIIQTIFGKISLILTEPDAQGTRAGRIDWSEISSSEQTDTVESLILAHACAGVDVESAAYIEGVNTTLEAVENNS